MKPAYLLYLAAVLTGCDDLPTHVSFGGPSEASLVGTWSGFAEITTAEDIGTNLGSPADRGFSFPVVINLERNGQFTLITSGYPTSFVDERVRTCFGIWTRDTHSISFFPTESCRALPMTRYVVGVVVPHGITLQASTSNSVSTLPVTMRVFYRLDRA